MKNFAIKLKENTIKKIKITITHIQLSVRNLCDTYKKID